MSSKQEGFGELGVTDNAPTMGFSQKEKGENIDRGRIAPHGIPQPPGVSGNVPSLKARLKMKPSIFCLLFIRPSGQQSLSCLFYLGTPYK